MTTIDNFDDATRCIISIMKESDVTDTAGDLTGSTEDAINMEFELTEYDISGGDKEFDSEANLGGGRLKSHTPQSDIEISLKGKFVGVQPYGLINTNADADSGSANVLDILSDDNREVYHLAILHTEDLEYAGTAFDATTDANLSTRDFYKNGEFTAVSKSFSGQKQEYTIKFKVTPKNKQAAKNWLFQSNEEDAAKGVIPAIITLS